MSKNIFSKYGRVNYRYDYYDHQIIFKISTDLHTEFYDTPVIELIINCKEEEAQKNSREADPYEPSFYGGCIVKDGIVIYRNNEIYFCENGKDWSIFSNYTLCTTIQLPDNCTVVDYNINYDEDHNLIYCWFVIYDSTNSVYDFVFAAFDVSRSKYVIPCMRIENGSIYPITPTGYVYNNILYMPYENENETEDPGNRYRMWKYSISSGELIEDVSCGLFTDATCEVTIASKYGFYKYVSDTYGVLKEIYWSTDNQSWNHITIDELLEYIPSLNTLEEYFLDMSNVLYSGYDHLELYSTESLFVYIYADLGVVTFPIEDVAFASARCGDTFIFDHIYNNETDSYYELSEQYRYSVLTHTSDINVTKSYLDMCLGNSDTPSAESAPSIQVYTDYDESDLGLPRATNLDINEYITKLDTSKYISGYNKSYEIIPGSDYIFVTSGYFRPNTLSNLPNIERYGYYGTSNSSNYAYYARIGSIRIHNEPAVALIDTREGSGDFLSNYIVVHGKQTVTVEWTLQVTNASFVGQPSYSNINLLIDTYTRSTTYGLNSMDDNVILFGKWNKVLAELPEGYTKAEVN